ncbi:hypothetical protein CU097_003180 [Rhizopus azygosporus]|uniref:Uncharacterized protein n=1 Tax=Rhizopus azygosporus TaxID=86630 RepID=A0A367JHW7_RHIAZ|nr:hypothetical protein CU097_003180 [Rhizopus azygosporus]
MPVVSISVSGRLNMPSNSIYDFCRENKGTVTEKAHQVQHMLPLLLGFFHDLKVSVDETAKIIKELKVEDEAVKKAAAKRLYCVISFAFRFLD